MYTSHDLPVLQTLKETKSLATEILLLFRQHIATEARDHPLQPVIASPQSLLIFPSWILRGPKICLLWSPFYIISTSSTLPFHLLTGFSTELRLWLP